MVMLSPWHKDVTLVGCRCGEIKPCQPTDSHHCECTLTIHCNTYHTHPSFNSPSMFASISHDMKGPPLCWCDRRGGSGMIDTAVTTSLTSPLIWCLVRETFILRFIVSSNFLGLLVSSYFFGLCLIYWDIAEGPREIKKTVTLEHIKNRGDVPRHWQHKST
jgi:hypothetical protein